MILIIIIALPFIASIISFLSRGNRLLKVTAIVLSLAEFVAVLFAAREVVLNGRYVFGAYFSVEAMGAILLTVVALIGFMAAWYSTGYLQREVSKGIIGFRRVRQYFVLLHLFMLAMFFAVITTNPILMWIAIEATTLSTAFLISFYNKPSATEAAWKYLLINSVGLLLGFFGTLLFLSPSISAGNHGLIDWHTLVSNAGMLDPFVAKIAFVFILVGYGTKVGLVPMHTWLPDAHSKAPVPISSLLSGVLLNIAFFAVLRFKEVIDLSVGSGFSSGLLIFFGILSIVVSSFIIFIQKNYKRLLAYSSIEHMGVVALGFGFGGAAVFAAILHMILHSLAKSILFLSAGNIFLKYSSTKMAKVKGVLSTLPVTGVLFIIGFVAITGVPPFGIFITEFSILSVGLNNHLVVTIIALIALSFVFIGFLRHVSGMMFGSSDDVMAKGEAGFRMIAPIVILIIILVGLSFFIPSSLTGLIKAATLAY